ncbi:hypothetical protein D3C79_1097410 [compost metagenome]
MSIISERNLNFVASFPKACTSFAFRNDLSFIYPVIYDNLGNTGIFPLLADITILFKKLPINIKIDPIIAL